MIAAALLDGFAISVNRFTVLAAPGERDAKTVISVGVIRLLGDRSAEGVDRAVNIAEVEQGAGELIMGARKVAVAHLYGHAIAVDGFIEPAFVIKDQTFIEILLRRVERAANRGIL